MAVMASTLSEPVSLDLMAGDPMPQKVSELNGHSDTPPAKTEQISTPLTNGNGKPESPNGVPEPKSLSEVEAHNAEAVQSNEQVSAKPQPAKEPSPQPESKPEPSPKPIVKEPAVEPLEDVVMGDAPNGDKVDALDEIEAAPPATLAESSNPPIKDATKDVEMAASSEAPKTDSTNGLEDTQIPDSEPPHPNVQEVDLHPASMSQLAIDGTENESFSAAASAEVSMADVPEAPPASSKLVREREEDPSDEPAAKRAKTESQPDEIAVQVPVDGMVVDKPEPHALSELAGWESPEADAKELTEYQRREFRKVISGIKKTKAGGHFRDSVERLWPTVWEAYCQVIQKPTDLALIDRNLRDNSVQTLGAFKTEVALLYKNCATFNGPEHDVTKGAWTVVDQIWSKVRDIPSEEPPKSKPAPKQMPTRHTEPRTVAQPPPRRESTGIVSSPVEKAAPAETYAVPPGGVPQVRRASTQNEGDRPKRAIHPPKNKDLDYTPKSVNKKKLPPELRFCHDVLEEIRDPKHFDFNAPFLHPVDPVALGIPTYFSVVKKPMDLQTMADRLAKGEYGTAKDFEKDMQLMFKNCAKFNANGTPVNLQGKQLEALFKAEWAKRDQWMAKNVQAKAESVGASESPTEAESDVEEEEEIEASPKDDSSKAVEELLKRLFDESETLHKLFKEPVLNLPRIQVQQVVVNTIQSSIIKEKEKAQTSAPSQKPEKQAKAKPSKPSKPRASGGGVKKASGAAAAKKAAGGAGGGGGRGSGGGAKKAGSKKNLTAHEKDLIAGAINDLESPNIEQAIELIKNDTGQNENDSGELELDIEQLSNECLVKLWDLCKKAIPGFGTDRSAPDASPVINSGPAAKQAPAKPSKPKKNKPMTAREQEERIAELNRLRELYKDGGSRAGQEPPSALPGPESQDDSSEDSDSEEE